jgi:MATE family multidrug resistance protein
MPAALHGALGFWSACTAGLVAAAAGLSGFLVWLWRQKTVA